MDHKEALGHMRTLINAASESDDFELVRKLLREMRVIVNKALPVKPRKPRKLRVVK